MREIKILGLNLRDYTVRETLHLVDQYLKSGVLNTIEYVSAQMIMSAEKDSRQKEWLESMDILVYCDSDIIRAANVTSRSRLKEIENNSFLKEFLKKLVRSGYNIFISGGTNSGKTTFLNALSAYIPADERVITIEDSAELQIQQVENLIRLETRTANPQGEGAITIGDLIRASLRMNPSRIIVGEVRGKEALELLNSYNTGHDGGMSSGHGNSPADMLARLETMVLMGADLPLAAIRSQIASALDVVIHLGRLRDKSRKVLWIVEVDDYEEGQIRLHTLYRFEDGALRKKGELKNREKLERAGEEV